MPILRRRIVVRGRAQGVSFRDAARRRAEALGVAGWVRNLPDGTVEAEVEGAGDDLEVLVAWFGHGPPQASVDAIDVSERVPLGERGFRVR